MFFELFGMMKVLCRSTEAGYALGLVKRMLNCFANYYTIIK